MRRRREALRHHPAREIDPSVGEHRNRALGSTPPLVVGCRTTEGRRGCFGERKRGDAPSRTVCRLVGVVTAEHLERAVAAEEARHHGLVAGASCGIGDGRGDFFGARDERRHEDHEQRVDVLILDEHVQGARVDLRTRRGDEVDGVRDPRVGRHEGAQRGLGRLGQLRHLEPGGDTRIRREDARSASVRDDRHASTGWQRLMEHDCRGVEQLLERVDADHAGLGEERVDGVVGRSECSGVRRGAARTGGSAAALDRDDRLVARDATREARELARVPERLEIEEDHIGVGVLVPVLEEVIAADVGLVPEGHEGRDPEAELRRASEQRDAEAARLRREADSPGDREKRRERRVHGDRGVRVDHAHAVRPDHAHAVSARGLDQLVLGRPCAASTSAKPAEITTSPCTCFRTQSSTTAATLAAGTHTTARSTGPGTASTVGYACTPATDVAFGLTGCTGPQKSPASRSRSTPLPIVPVRRLAPTTAMDVGERMRATERAFRHLLALALRADRGTGRLDVERDLDDATVGGLVDLEPGVGEDFEHPRVAHHRHGDEAPDAVLAGDRGEVLEHHRAEPAALLLVLDRERHLGLVGGSARAHVARGRDDRVSELGDDGEPPVVVDVGQLLEVASPRRGDS